MSAWIPVAIAFQRMLAIAAPQNVKLLSTPSQARLLLSGLCIICTAITAYPMWTVGIHKDGDSLSTCLIINETYYEWLIVTFIVGSLVLPETLLIICTLVIIYHLTRFTTLHRQVSNTTTYSGSKHVSICFICVKIYQYYR
jgi:7 transmembrane receptor (rhodopsin family)